MTTQNANGLSDYQAFLQSKIAVASHVGIETIQEAEVHPLLKPHQRAIVQWAIQGGRRAIFASFGLGKTLMQLEICRLILQHHGGGKALIVTPLGIRQEFTRDAAMIGQTIQFIRSMEEAEDDGLYMTNYETIRDGKLDPRGFLVVSLDEASILRGFGGTKTFRELMKLYEGTAHYRFVATATPSPNDYIELLAYAAYLDVMSVGEAKTRFFKRNSEKADALTIHPHKEEEFWLWVASWAILLQRPSDLGAEYSDEGYDLPPLDVRWHKLDSDHRQHTFARDGQGSLLRCAALGVQQASAEKRISLSTRIERMVALVDEAPGEHFVLWHDLEAERRGIKAALPEAVEVYGTQALEIREQHIIDFSDGQTRLLATKPVISGAGCNFQRHCHRAIFLGIGFKFYEFIQSVHRIHRFLQDQPVRIDLIYTEAEEEIRKTLERKWQQHIAMTERMRGIIREYGLAQVALASALHRTIGVEREDVAHERFHLIHDDAVAATGHMPTDAVHLILTSIPFSTQYEYTPSINDMGHNHDNAAFWQQMDFLTPHLYRILAPGRVALIHVKDRTVPGGVSGLGFQSLYPFHADAIRHYQQHGFAFLGMKTIVTDVVRENNQTYRLGWSEQCKDGTKMGCGVPEYLLIFRKPPTDQSDGYADVPVTKQKPQTERPDGSVGTYDYDGGKIVQRSGYSRSRWQIDAHGFARSNGNRLLTPEELMTLPHHMIFKRWREESLSTVYNLARHVEIAEVMEREKRLPSNFMLLPPHSWHPDVWTDIARMRTMNMLQAVKGREMHLCPLQFDIADRAILQHTQEGEIVYDPFMGLGTVPLRAVMLNRVGWGVDLSKAYYQEALWHMRHALTGHTVPMLYDLMDAEEAGEAITTDNEEVQSEAIVA